MSAAKNINITLKIWRQKNAKAKGAIETYKLDNVSTASSFLEMLDHLLLQTTEKYLIVLKNIDGFISEESYTIFYRQICHLVKKYPNLTFILFPSDQGYLKIDEENIKKETSHVISPNESIETNIKDTSNEILDEEWMK